ncbi:MAG: phosphotransferase [Planctomycetota bacterium]
MKSLSDIVCEITGYRRVELGETIQSLWSGYGVIQRARLIGSSNADQSSVSRSVVIKHIDLSQSRTNRRGWGGDVSHQRKIRSYRVEKVFYESFASRCGSGCRLPDFVAACEKEAAGGWVLVLQDLDDVGFGGRNSEVDSDELLACLRWLADFHATFLHQKATGLWPVGTYWHLETRPDEFAAMVDGPLKRCAARLDRRLNQAQYQTLVHGDAKIANFCFSETTPNRVAAVDFQYVGHGCGIKDVAYLLSSCRTDREIADQQDDLLDFYFDELRLSLASRDTEMEFSQLEVEWRQLYPYAWADFCRFLLGWSPGHWKLNQYTDQMIQMVLKDIENT